MGFLVVFILVPCLHRKDDEPDGRVVRVIIILKLYPLLNFSGVFWFTMIFIFHSESLDRTLSNGHIWGGGEGRVRWALGSP